MGKKTWAALALGIAASAVAAAPASAATVTVTGDDGTPVALTPGAPASIRNMNVDVALALAAGERGAALSVAGPVATSSSPSTCSSGGTRRVDYQGNGTYTVSVTSYTTSGCSGAGTPATYQFVIGAGTAITPPTGAVLTRKPNDFGTETYQVPVALNPGALSTSLFFAAGATVGPDGAIAGPSSEAFVDTQTGTAPVRFENPGTYTMVARAKAFSGAAGQFFSPFSPPVTVRAFAPFDLQGTPTFPDSRGDSYKLGGVVREQGARGAKIRISLAGGHKGGKFRSIGKARIRAGGKFTKRFTIRNPGKYRLKYVFKGNAKVLPGAYVQKFKITRRFI